MDYDDNITAAAAAAPTTTTITRLNIGIHF